VSFDRIKQPDAWSRRHDDSLGDPQGRAALFTGADEAVRAAKAGPENGVAVNCSRCGETRRIDTRTAGRMAAPLFLVAPWKRHPIFAVCPSCGVRSWLRLKL
jgi:hypothetical protein